MNTDLIISYLTLVTAVLGALFAALWLSLVFWAFRDMRSRSRDPFAQLMAALVVIALPIVGVIVYLILRPGETLAEAYERALEEEALLQAIEERPACPGCSRSVEGKWILCPYCHTRLKKACPDCNSLMELQWNLCPFCGNQQVDPYRFDVTATPLPPISAEAGGRLADVETAAPGNGQGAATDPESESARHPSPQSLDDEEF